MEEEKKPFYKRWWFWVIVAVILIAIASPNSEKDNEAKPETEEVATDEETKNEEAENEDEEDEPIIIEVDEEVTSVDYTAKVQRVKISDDILTVVFDWENQSDWDPAHFPLLGYVEVKQNDELLEQVGDLDRQNKQIKQGQFDVYDLEYELIDDSDVTIRIVSTNENDGSEGEIIVKIN